MQRAKVEIEDRSAEVIDRVKDVGGEQIDKARDFIVDHPFQSVAGGIVVGLLLRSLLRGPATTLLLMGGAAFLGSKYAGETER